MRKLYMEEKRKISVVMVLYYLLTLLMIAGGVLLAVLQLSLVAGIIIAAIGLIGLLFAITIYNQYVSCSNKVKESLGLVDIQLKQRFDLVPNLVNTVKGYAKHEKELFEEVTRLRNEANNAVNEKDKLDLANKTLGKMKSIIAVAEDYPELKADRLFQELMDEMVLIEDKLVAARRFYDSNVTIYNTMLQVFPKNLIAKGHGFKTKELFRIDSAERLNIKVEL